MPSSNSLLDNRSFNKLAVNRLEAQAIQSDNISSQTPSYLFSAVFDNATFDRNSTGGTLTFTKDDVVSIIQFSDRPFRKTENISITEFVNLFTLGGSNSFEKDPPNMVLVHNEEQRTYEMKLSSQSENQAIFTLLLLPGETHDLTTVTGRMSLFVDNATSTPTFTKLETFIFNIGNSTNLTIVLPSNPPIPPIDVLPNYVNIDNINLTNIVRTSDGLTGSLDLTTNNITAGEKTILIEFPLPPSAPYSNIIYQGNLIIVFLV